MNHHEKGFTTIELLMAISITFITVGFIYGVYYESQRTLRTWNQKINLEDAAFICIKQLTSDMAHAYSIKVLNNDSLVIVQVNDKQILYCRLNDNVYRNGYPLLDKDHRIVDWSFQEHSKFSTENNQENVFIQDNTWQSEDQNYLPEIPLFEVELTLANKNRSITIRSAIQMRNGFDGVFHRVAFQE